MNVYNKDLEKKVIELQEKLQDSLDNQIFEHNCLEVCKRLLANMLMHETESELMNRSRTTKSALFLDPMNVSNRLLRMTRNDINQMYQKRAFPIDESNKSSHELQESIYKRLESILKEKCEVRKPIRMYDYEL